MSIPTEPGYYWRRDVDEGCGEAYEWEIETIVREGKKLTVVNRAGASPSNVKGEWGPRIPDPEEKQEQDEEVAAMRALLAESEISLRPIRDNFAAAALTGLVAQTDRALPVTTFASEAYKIANAMLAERDKNA